MAPGRKIDRKDGERYANRRDDSFTQRSRLFAKHNHGQDAHPRQMRDPCRKHHEHERPAAAKTVKCVAETEPEPIECRGDSCARDTSRGDGTL